MTFLARLSTKSPPILTGWKGEIKMSAMRDPAVEKLVTTLLEQMRELETAMLATQTALITVNALVGQPNVKPYSPENLDALVIFGQMNPNLLEKMRLKYQPALDIITRLVADGMLSPEDEKVLEELSRKNAQN
jgi:hypothetical protein